MKLNGKFIGSDYPIVMGILNATPDSFYNKGRESSTSEIIVNAARMIEEGATILDIGGQSSRPNAELISTQIECERVIPIVRLLRSTFPDILLSVDTFQSEVAKQCIDEGIDLINDISAGNMDANMLPLVAKRKIPYICMHMQGTPQTMQQHPSYNQVVHDVYDFFEKKLSLLNTLGIANVILDVGFGFGKTLEQNYELLNELASFTSFKKPLLAGLSRKSMVYKPLHSNAELSLNGTTALHMIALQKGASILRVHDVHEAVECIQLHKKIMETKYSN